MTHRGWRGAHVKAIPYAQVDYVLDRRHSLELFANRPLRRDWSCRCQRSIPTMYANCSVRT